MHAMQHKFHNLNVSEPCYIIWAFYDKTRFVLFSVKPQTHISSKLNDQLNGISSEI